MRTSVARQSTDVSVMVKTKSEVQDLMAVPWEGKANANEKSV